MYAQNKPPLDAEGKKLSKLAMTFQETTSTRRAWRKNPEQETPMMFRKTTPTVLVEGKPEQGVWNEEPRFSRKSNREQCHWTE